jgi:hypothetical protein
MAPSNTNKGVIVGGGASAPFFLRPIKHDSNFLYSQITYGRASAVPPAGGGSVASPMRRILPEEGSNEAGAGAAATAYKKGQNV